MPNWTTAEIMDRIWPNPPEDGRPAQIYRNTQRFIDFVKRRPEVLAPAMALTELVLGPPTWRRRA